MTTLTDNAPKAVQKKRITLPGHIYSMPVATQKKRRITLPGHGYAMPKASRP